MLQQLIFNKGQTGLHNFVHCYFMQYLSLNIVVVFLLLNLIVIRKIFKFFLFYHKPDH